MGFFFQRYAYNIQKYYDGGMITRTGPAQVKFAESANFHSATNMVLYDAT